MPRIPHSPFQYLLENALCDGYTGLDVRVPVVFLRLQLFSAGNPFQTSGVMSRVRSCPIHQNSNICVYSIF